MTQIVRFMTLSMAVALSFCSAPSFAQSSRNCGPRPEIVSRLAEQYGETRQSIGIGANNSVVEVFASSETRTWTITVTSTEGLLCLVASGQDFELTSETLPPAGETL